MLQTHFLLRAHGYIYIYLKIPSFESNECFFIIIYITVRARQLQHCCFVALLHFEGNLLMLNVLGVCNKCNKKQQCCKQKALNGLVTC